MQIKIYFIIIFALITNAAFAERPFTPTIAGQWRGLAHTSHESTRLVLDLENQVGKLTGAMGLPDVGVSGWPAATVKLDESGLTLIFPSDSGGQVMRLRQKGSQLVGQWIDPQNKSPANITLKRFQQATNITEKRVAIKGPAGTIGASLISPACQNKCTGIVFLHGSGAEPRDTNRFAALAFAEQGIASLIFDKRGVGESTGKLNGVNFNDLAADGIAAANYLASLPQIAHVGFIGHSQGGWVAPLAASQWHRTAFVITSAGPAVPPSREAEWDVVYALRHAGLGNKTKIAEDNARQVLQLFHDGIRSGNWQPFEAAMKHAKTQSWYAKTPLNNYADHSDSSYLASYRAFMDYDPLPSLQALSVPMLAILSPDDESIDSVETIDILQGLIKSGKSIQLKLLPGYNHSMRRISRGGKPLRWPSYPTDYFSNQAKFIHAAVTNSIR
nr:alpha/beta hydrolase [uncultured Undibacterium sp.]